MGHFDDDPRVTPRDGRHPERRAIEKQVHSGRAEVARIEQAYGAAAADNLGGRRPSMRGFKIAHGTIGKELRAARKHLANLVEHRRAVPKRIDVREISDDAVVKLATER